MAHGQEASTEQAAAAAGAAALCANGCGFYGSVATKNMCSKCYRDHLKAIDADPVEGKKIKPNEAVLTLPAFKELASLHDSAAAASEAPVAAAAAEAPSKKAAPTRCMSCKKKVGLLGFACRCGGTFCSLHRYVDEHACDFDYKKADREKIAQQNPLVVAPKLNNI